MQVLNPYIRNGDVTLTDWSYTYDYQNHSEWIGIQAGAYMDTINRYGTTTKWLAAIDIDEFLFCPTGKSLVEFLKKYKKYGGLCVNWKPFGTSNISDIPKGFLQIEMLIYATDPKATGKAKHLENYFVKSIVQPKYVKGCASAHSFQYVKGKFHVDVRGHKLKAESAKKILIDKIRINHYWTRTVRYLWDNKIASRLKRRKDFSPERMLKLAAKYNKCINTDILQYVAPLRLALQNKKEIGVSETGRSNIAHTPHQ